MRFSLGFIASRVTLAGAAAPCYRTLHMSVRIFLNRGIEAVLEVIVSVVDVVVEADHMSCSILSAKNARLHIA